MILVIFLRVVLFVLFFFAFLHPILFPLAIILGIVRIGVPMDLGILLCQLTLGLLTQDSLLVGLYRCVLRSSR